MSVCEKARAMERAATEAEDCISRLAQCLLKEGISERAFCLLKSAVFAISDLTPNELLDVRIVDGTVYQWNVEV